MAIEIERKFIVNDHSFKEKADSAIEIQQGYLSRDPERTVRVRIKGDKGFLTVKGLTSNGITREEYEYEIPVDDARRMLAMCPPPIINKIRYLYHYQGYLWEIDDFEYPRQMTIAEIELPDENTDFPLPPFIADEVTGRPEYYNSAIK